MNDDTNVRICKSDIIYYACTDSIFRKISKNKKLLTNKGDFSDETFFTSVVDLV